MNTLQTVAVDVQELTRANSANTPAFVIALKKYFNGNQEGIPSEDKVRAGIKKIEDDFYSKPGRSTDIGDHRSVQNGVLEGNEITWALNNAYLEQFAAMTAGLNPKIKDNPAIRLTKFYFDAKNDFVDNYSKYLAKN
jgi:hypothetical protein